MNEIRMSATVVLAVVIAVIAAGCSRVQEPEQTGAMTDMGSSMESTGAGDQMAGMSMGMMDSIYSTIWDGMKVELVTTTPTSFVLFQGTETRQVAPEPGDDVHMMVLLSDAEVGERIPYATVWLTIKDENGAIVFDERMWPMISRSMGTHYGINVDFPGAATYDIVVQVGPPQAARHPEYADRWLEARTFETSFKWSGMGS